MKIAFSKVTNNKIPFEIKENGIVFSGNLVSLTHNLVKCHAEINGEMTHNCDRCGNDINIKINESVELILSDGIYKDSEDCLDDAIEFFDGFINLDDVLVSEIEAYKSNYFYVKIVKIYKGEKNGST